MATTTGTRKDVAKRVALHDAYAAVADDLVTITEIAQRLGYPRVTVEKWRQRSAAYAAMDTEEDRRYAFPAPRLLVANGKTGLWSYVLDVLPWAEYTERGPFMASESEDGGK
jgi:hypothetical protein